jgi:cytosolic phospholipase A2
MNNFSKFFITLYFIFSFSTFNFVIAGDSILSYVNSSSKQDEYSKIPAYVRLSDTLPDYEKKFIENRFPKAKVCIENILTKRIKNCAVPRIALCFSGGGYRAMIESIGFLKAVDEVGLLDSIMYMSGLSGSTWAINPWVASGLSIDDYFKQLAPKLNISIFKSCQNLAWNHYNDLISLMARKHLDGQYVGIVDVYGAMLANNLLRGIVKDPLNYPLSALIPNLSGNKYPLPISTAVMGGVGKHHNWIEFTPFEIGSSEIGFVPTWSFGRKFEQGVSKLVFSDHFANQQSLGFLMGIWGSAFALDLERLQFELSEYKDCSLYNTLNSVFKYMGWHENNAGAAYLPNFSYNMKRDRWFGVFGGTDILFNKQPDISFIDGAFDLIDGNSVNLGIIPLLRKERQVDIIIVCDASFKNKGASSLRAAEKRAKALGLKFPKIDYKNIDQTTVSVFEDCSSNNVPTIIYIPDIANKHYGSFDPYNSSYTATTNFCYTSDQVCELAGLARRNLLDSKDAIIDAIRHVVNKKSVNV